MGYAVIRRIGILYACYSIGCFNSFNGFRVSCSCYSSLRFYHINLYLFKRQCKFTLKSKNKKSLYLYLCYFYTFINRQLKDNYTLKIFSNKTLKYFVSLLKSPFIYKEAQEHHGFTCHKANIQISSLKKVY